MIEAEAVRELYRALLGREASEGDVAWQVGNKLPAIQIAANIQSSLEYSQRAISCKDAALPATRSRAVSLSEISSPWYADVCALLGTKPILHRKQWEWVAILAALLQQFPDLRGRRGLGFGVGEEPMPSALACLGSEIVATDQPPTTKGAEEWEQTEQLCRGKEALNKSGLCLSALFEALVSFRHVDMREIPSDLLDFDYCWSSCCFEHLGSLRAGLDFVEASLGCLRPGGIAVHTTEFNVSSNVGTVEEQMLCLYRRKDFEEFAARIAKAGHRVAPLCFDLGSSQIDEYVHKSEAGGSYPHLRLRVGRYATTSFILVVEKSK